MSLVLDLRTVDTKDRSRSWQRTIRDQYLDLDIRFQSQLEPSGMIAHSRVGSMALGAISSVPQVHERTEMRLSDDVDHLMGVMQFQGRMHLTQHGRDNTLTPGSFLLLDSDHPYHAEFPDEYQIFVVKIPRLFFSDVLHSDDRLVNVCFDERHGSMVIVDYFRRMARDFEHIPMEQRVRMSSHGVRLLVDTLMSSVR